jgi:predicted acetyltransferase
MSLHAFVSRAAVCEPMERLLPAPETFEFRNPGPLFDAELQVTLTSTHLPNGMGIEVPTYCFMVSVQRAVVAVGHVHLRVGESENLRLYQGHIGYGVDVAWRGRHFAERATRLILPLARTHGLTTLWITCDPTNIASRRTCERLGAKYVETVAVPPSALAYRFGARQKRRYRLDL